MGCREGCDSVEGYIVTDLKTRNGGVKRKGTRDWRYNIFSYI